MRYFIGFLITIGLIILLIVLLAGGGGGKKVPQSSRQLASYADTDAAAALIIDGPINAPQNHEQVQITVTRDTITYSQVQGYEDNVVRSKTYANSEASYNNFLHALDKAGFTQGDTSGPKDERGYCPLGNRYVLKFNQNDQDLERFWATSCGGTHTYQGNLSLTVQLFENQVADFDTLTNGLLISL